MNHIIEKNTSVLHTKNFTSRARAIIFYIALAALAPLPGQGFDLVKGGAPAACFQFSGELPDRRDVEAFNSILKECTGASLPEAPDAAEKKMNVIKFKIEKRGMADDDSFEITFPSDGVMLITCSKISARWALNKILEDFAGVRFVMPGKYGAHCPKSPDVSVPEKKIAVSASYNLFRCVNMCEPAWGVSLNEKKWNSYRFFNHSMSLIFPVEKYGGPEWRDRIMPLRNGKRFVPRKGSHYGLWQPCFSNPAAVSEAVKNICAYFDANPDAKTFSLAINDLGGFCSCEKCLKLNGGVKRSVFTPGYANYSNLFYQWANKVMAGVLVRHPDKYFGCCAYREISDPPDFKLNDRLTVVLTLDLYSMCDPDIKARHERLFSSWRNKAALLGVWEYGYGLTSYSLPRVFFKLQADAMKYCFKAGARLFFLECSMCFSEGPKHYLYGKLAFDVNADADKLLNEWYDACAGPDAAPFLKQYYDIFNNFWLGREVRKTVWFRPGNIYLPLDPIGSYLYAFSGRDLTRARELIEKVESIALRKGDANQKMRASKLRLYHDYYEALAIRGGCSVMPLSGSISNKEEALALVKRLPALFHNAEKLPEISERLVKRELADTLIVKEWHKKYFNALKVKRNSFYVIALLNKIMPFADEPEVKNALRKLVSDRSISEKGRDNIAGFIERGKSKNLVDMVFRPDEWNRTGSGYSAAVSQNGRAFRVVADGGWRQVQRSVPMKPDSNYLYRVKISSEKIPLDVRILFSAVREKDGMIMQSYNSKFVKIRPGKPETLELAHLTPLDSRFKFSKGLLLVIFQNLPKNAAANIESMEFYDISEPPAGKR